MHDFLLEVEVAVYEYAKSALIDAELLKYSQALIVAGIFSAALEVSLNYVRDFYLRASAAVRPNTKIPVIDTDSLRVCCEVWDRILSAIFGPGSKGNIDNFGRYIVLR